MLMLELHWCADCGADTGLERPGGDGSPEGACVDCGSALFLWAEPHTTTPTRAWGRPRTVVGHPAAMRTTPSSAVATPAA